MHFVPVGCLNNDRTVMSKAFAWRPMALLPILKASSSAETDKDWLVLVLYDIVYDILYDMCYDVVYDILYDLQ